MKVLEKLSNEEIRIWETKRKIMEINENNLNMRVSSTKIS